MGQVVPFMTDFLGFQTDPPIDQMPRGFARRMKNFLPTGVSPAQMRSDYELAQGSPGITGVTGTSFQVKSMAWSPVTENPFGTQVYEVALITAIERKQPTPGNTIDTYFYYDGTLDGSTAPTLLGAVVSNTLLLQPLVYHKSIVIACLEPTSGGVWGGRGGGGGSVVVKKLAKVGHANLGGTPPAAKRCASWGEYLILGNSIANPRRVWFSAVGNAESWDTTTGYADVPEEVMAIQAKGNMIFVFGPEYCHLLLGDTPPPGGNLTLKKYFIRHGCADPRAVTTYKDLVIWGDASGIWKSDGSQPTDLARSCGISSFWKYIVGTGSGLTSMIFKTYLNYLFVSVSTSGGNWSLVIDLERNVAMEWELGNPSSYETAPSDVNAQTREELYMGRSGSQQAYRVGPCFVPASGFAPSALPYLLTGANKLGTEGYKRFRRVYVKYAGHVLSGAPQVVLFASTEPNAGFGDPAGNPPGIDPVGASWFASLGAGTGAKTIRAPASLGKKGETLQLAVWLYTTGGTLDDFRLHSLEVEVTPLDPARDGDSRA